MSAWDWSFEMGVRTLYQEARGEPDDGRKAVAHVLWNRVRSHKWGGTMAEVCLYPMQFSGWNVHDPNRMETARVPDDDPTLSELRAILTAAQTEDDPTTGAQFYYATSIPEPTWAQSMTFVGQFGHQRFYRDVT